MLNDRIILNLVVPKKKKLGFYVFIVDLFLITCGLMLLNIKVFSFEVVFFVFIGIPFISIFIFIGINHNMKNFRFSNDRIIILRDKIIKEINNNCIIESYSKIDKITLKYRGFDEGPFNHPIFNPNPKLGNGNFIEIYSNYKTLETYEFYLKSKRDSILLKNILESLRTRIKVEIILVKNSR